MYTYELVLVLSSALTISAHVIDRISSQESDVYAMTLWASVVQLILILPFVGVVDLLSPAHALLIFVAAGFSSFARSRWFLALSKSRDSLSKLVPLTRLSSIFVLIFAVALLGETLSPLAAFGALTMILGAMTVMLDRPSATLREFLQINWPALLVLLVAFSRAGNNISSKYVLTMSEVNFFRIYFHLKLFECITIVVAVIANARLRSRYSRISRPRAFVGARALQTAAGLLFILAISRLDLTRAEPLTAVGPLLLLLWEWLDRKFHILERAGITPPATAPLTPLGLWLRIAGTIMIFGGFLLLEYGRQ